MIYFIMTAKNLFNYYNHSKAHEHLNCSLKVVEKFLEIYSPLKYTSLKHADVCFHNYLYNMFFER